tara:strand:+ start:36458 stop:37282 length:825 start_codon:yes stop_codon:yes gene_type:complete
MKKSLNEELKRHMQIINYANRLDNVIEERFKVTFQEQEPEAEPEEEVEGGEDTPPTPGATPTPPTPGATPPTPGGGTPKASTGPKNLPPKPDLSGGNRPVPPPPPAPATPATPPTPPAPATPATPAPGVDVDEDVEEIDVTDLVNNTEEVGDTVDKFAKQLSDIESKFSELSGQLNKMDMVFQKIDNIEMEIEKMAPQTPIEKMELRSLDSFPYNQRLDDYFENKKGEYKRLRGVDLDVEPQKEKEYTLTVGDTEEWDDNSIGKSFNPDYDENN